MDSFRLLDSGARPAAENIALDDALLSARCQNTCQNTIRFLQYKPRAVLVGLHQAVEQEVRLDYCRAHGIDVNRRISGGGAIYFDETQLGWEVVAGKDEFNYGIDELYGRMCEPVIRGLKKLGVSAEFRPKNDIEVGGRKISGTGGTERKNAFLFQGTLLVDFDVETMLRALRIPTKKLSDKEIGSVRERVTCLKEILGCVPPLSEIKAALASGFSSAFNAELVEGGLTSGEEKLFAGNLSKIASREWLYDERHSLPKHSVLYSIRKTPGGLVRASLVVRGSRIQSALLTGDFFAHPERAVMDLEAALKDAKATAENARNIVKEFFSERRPRIPGVTSGDLSNVIVEALEKTKLTEFGLTCGEANSVFAVGGSFEEITARKPGLLLLPYCSKLYDCSFRQKEDCGLCGRCSAGGVYELAEELGMDCVGVCNFEHLMETLREQKKQGAKSYIGFCCEAFYGKHQHELEAAGLPGILVDIEGETCYDLGLEQEAYKGEFKNQTELKMGLIKKILVLHANSAGLKASQAHQHTPA